jgi:hypothetical protein
MSIGLYPVPSLTELLGKGSTTQSGMVRDQLLDESNVLTADEPTAIFEDSVHGTLT